LKKFRSKSEFKREVMSWVVLLKNAERKCESISIENYWPKRVIREGKVNNDTGNLFWL